MNSVRYLASEAYNALFSSQSSLGSTLVSNALPIIQSNYSNIKRLVREQDMGLEKLAFTVLTTIPAAYFGYRILQSGWNDIYQGRPLKGVIKMGAGLAMEYWAVFEVSRFLNEAESYVQSNPKTPSEMLLDEADKEWSLKLEETNKEWSRKLDEANGRWSLQLEQANTECSGKVEVEVEKVKSECKVTFFNEGYGQGKNETKSYYKEEIVKLTNLWTKDLEKLENCTQTLNDLVDKQNKVIETAPIAETNTSSWWFF